MNRFPKAYFLSIFILLGVFAAVAVIRSSQEQPSSSRARGVEATPSPRPPRTAPRRPVAQPEAQARVASDPAASGPSGSLPGVTAASTVAPAANKPTRVEQLRMTVLQDAVRRNWVTVNEQGAPCPPQQVRILYSLPGDLSSYDKGAYFEPLGPAPTESSKEINGLLICEGYSHLYRGFEAFYRPERDQWDVFPFPVIE